MVTMDCGALGVVTQIPKGRPHPKCGKAFQGHCAELRHMSMYILGETKSDSYPRGAGLLEDD